MHALSIFAVRNTEVVAMLAVCALSVGFMVRFFIALLLEVNGISDSRQESIRRSGRYPTFRPKALSTSDDLLFYQLSDTAVTASQRCPHVTPIDTAQPVDSEPRAVKARWLIVASFMLLTPRLSAQDTGSSGQSGQSPAGQTPESPTVAARAATPSPPTPLPTPTLTGPLQAAPPIEFDGGPFGKLDFNGTVSGIGLWQGNHVSGDNPIQAALSNGQVFLQKPSGWWQFYVQAGAYNIPALGTAFLSTEKAIADLYGPVPVAYLKLAPAKNTSVMIGALPTLMGAEYTFDFQNMSIERGLLWNQENAINRGIQVNQTLGKFTASLSWNDGYYSNRYSWLSGSLTYTNGPHSLSFTGMGNLGQTKFQTLATPVQNNSVMYAAIYTYTKGSWIVQPYYQYSDVPTNPEVGVLHGASTNGGALLVSRAFKRGFSLAGRGEYITSTGSLAGDSVNLLYGPGSSAWSITLTPTYQYRRFFARGDLSLVRAIDITPGAAFGPAGTNPSQPRGVMEVGFLF